MDNFTKSLLQNYIKDSLQYKVISYTESINGGIINYASKFNGLVRIFIVEDKYIELFNNNKI